MIEIDDCPYGCGYSAYTPEDVRKHVLRDHEASHRAAKAVDDAWERNSYVSPKVTKDAE